MDTDQDPLAEARRLGRLEAEAFDRALRDEERHEREARLARLVVIADGEELELASGPAAGGAEVVRLRRDVERLASFHNALLRSRSWRILQVLRRPFGRTW